MNEYLQIVLLAIGASFVERTTGFGFGIFIMTMLPFLMPSYGEATTLSGLLALTTTLIICVRMWKVITWKHLWPILITFIIVSAGPVFLLSRMEIRSLTKLLGIVLILISIYFLCLGGRIRIKPTVKNQIITGTLSGLMGLHVYLCAARHSHDYCPTHASRPSDAIENDSINICFWRCRTSKYLALGISLKRVQ